MRVKGIHSTVDVWDLRGLREDQSAASPYLEIQDDRIRLRALDLDLAQLPDHERSAIQKALARALVQLSTAQQE
jgi:hypothetical protein